jgi:HEAT repeat protein
LAKADPNAARPLLDAALTGAETRLQLAAVRGAVAAYGQAASAQLAPMLGRVGPTVRVQILSVLDASAEKAVLDSVRDADEAVRLAAIEALGRVCGAAGVPVLLELTQSSSRPEKQMAETALVRISGPGASDAVVAAATTGQAPVRVAAMTALAARKQATAVPALLKVAGEPDRAVKSAAFSAIGKLGSDADFAAVARLAWSRKDREGISALEAMAGRVNDKSTASKTLLGVVGATPKDLSEVLDVLSGLGSPEALEVVGRLAGDSDAGIQEEAVRALGNWNDLGAGKLLADLAVKHAANAKLQGLALQGLVRVIKSAEAAPVKARAELALAAWGMAQRDQDKKLALSALGAVPHASTAAALKPLLMEASLKIDAGMAAITLAENLVATDKRGAKDLARAIQEANISQDVGRRATRVLSR